MSPSVLLASSHRCRFPRVSGDEPVYGAVLGRVEPFSPRERG